MPRELMRRDYLLLAAVMGGFALIVVVGIVSRDLDRILGAVLTAIGVTATLCAERLSAAKAALGESVPLWPGRNTLRPLTVRLWGLGVSFLGTFMMLGI